MSSPFVAEIRIFACNFAPTGWAFCAGQLLPLSQNTALFSLLGTTYGGDGKSNFALPNMESNVALQQGQGQGLTNRILGEEGGSQFVTLIQTEMPVHSHTINASVPPGTLNQPGTDRSLARASGGTVYQSSNAGLVSMNFQTLSIAGGSLPHNNLMPYLVLNYCIALQGVFPQRP